MENSHANLFSHNLDNDRLSGDRIGRIKMSDILFFQFIESMSQFVREMTVALPLSEKEVFQHLHTSLRDNQSFKEMLGDTMNHSISPLPADKFDKAERALNDIKDDHWFRVFYRIVLLPSFQNDIKTPERVHIKNYIEEQASEVDFSKLL